MKIQLAREQAENNLKVQRDLLLEREYQAEIRRQQFEKAKQEEFERNKVLGQQKQEMQKKIFQDAVMLEQEKKEQILS